MRISESTLYQLVAAVSTVYLQVSAYVFLRILPWSQQLTRGIVTSSILYLIAFLTRQRAIGADATRLWLRKTKGEALWIISALLNVASMVFVLDFMYRAHLLHSVEDLSFTRMGWVDATSARIVVRAPQQPSVNLAYAVSEDTADPESLVWVSAPSQVPTADDDYVLNWQLEGLGPETTYRYRTDRGHLGSFSTPSRYPKRWSMVSSSCMKSFFPYSPFEHSLSIPGMRHLQDYLKVRKIDFVLFLGDFIYIDLPIRLGWSEEHYRKAYRQVYASPSWNERLSSVPWIHAYDDHEISNNWSANESGIFEDAINAFAIYQHRSNPPPHRSDGAYYSFNHGDVSFFVLDTRRCRSAESIPDGPEKTMLGARQLADLQEWLKSTPGWRVVASSVPFTRNFRSPDSNDSWAGYLWEREQILKTMWSTGGALVLSGVGLLSLLSLSNAKGEKDRHEHATTDLGGGVMEFSTSPLSQFYEPFRRDYQQVEDSDKLIFHRREGQSKFASFTFDTRNASEWRLDVKLIVDGASVWTYTMRKSVSG